MVGFLKDAKIGFAVIGNNDDTPFDDIYYALSLLMNKDPDKDLNMYIKKNHMKKLCGQYTKFADIGSARVSYENGLLHITQTLPPQKIPINTKRRRIDTNEIYLTLNNGVKYLVKFREEENNRIHFTMERNSSHKIS